MAYISKALRKQVTERAKGYCEYCQTAQAIVIEMEIDHVLPESAGGETQLSNLCLACISCNTFKHDFLTEIDPITNEQVSLFNPRIQMWIDHFEWNENGTKIVGLSPIGRATVERLQMNREIVINARHRWVQAGWHPPKLT